LKANPKILIVNPFGLGDVLFSMPLVEALKKSLPDSKIYFLCNERTDALVAMNPAIEKHFVFNRDYWRAQFSNPFAFLRLFSSWLGELKKERFDLAFDLSLGRDYSFFLMLIGVKERIGLDYKKRGAFLTKKLPLKAYADKPVADYQLELLNLAGIATTGTTGATLEIPNKAIEHADWFLKKHGLGSHAEVLAIAPGGGRSWGNNARYKQWAPERFSEAANQLANAKNFFVIVIGDRDEKALLEEVARGIDAPHAVIAGEPLSQVCAYLAHSRLLIANDGGLLHLGHALGIRTVGIYGPVDAVVYGPYPKTAKSRILTASVECRPCYQNFRFPPCGHERQCLDKIPANEVIRVAEEVL
jgi:heptosyltransferase-1